MNIMRSLRTDNPGKFSPEDVETEKIREETMTAMRSESLYKIEEPDISGIITEDDTPVDNMFSEKQRRLLTESLNSSWTPGRNFIAASDVGIFYAVSEPPIVPDMFLSMDVKLPEDLWKKKNRSYFLWEYGKPPEVAVEIVSNSEGGENSRKLGKYARIGVWYYIIFDPQRYIQNDVLRIYECFAGQFIPKIDRILQRIGLGLMLWDGEFEGKYDRWLRWCDARKNMILTGFERAVSAESRAEEAEGRAEEAENRAEKAEEIAASERQRAEKLAQRLKALGIEPEE